MNVIIFKVKGNTLTRVGGVDPASAGGKQTRFRFLFDDKDWKGVTTATVTQFFDIRDSKNIIISDIRNGVAECELHSDLRAISGVLWVGITGVNPQTDQTLDCILTAVPVGQGGAVSEVISTKLYLQFLEYVLEIKEQIKAIEDKLIDEDNPITTSLIQNLSITPEKLDRKYWEKISPVDTVIKKADDLFNVTGFINSGGSIALINVDMTVNIGEDEVELVNINGFCYAVGIKFDSGDTVYLNNITDGTQWKINRYNEGSELVPVYKLQCFKFGGSGGGSVDVETLDRRYLLRCVTEYGETISTFAELFEKVGRINRGGKLGFVKLYVSDNDNDTVLNYGYISGDFMAVGTPTNSDICLIDLRSGENWTVSKRDEEKYTAYKVDALTPRVVQLEKNAKIIVLGDINSMSELMTYSFSKDYLYHFSATGSLGDLIGEGYCFGRYSTEENPETGELINKFLEVFNFTTLKTWKINFKEATAELVAQGNDEEALSRKLEFVHINLEAGSNGDEELKEYLALFGTGYVGTVGGGKDFPFVFESYTAPQGVEVVEGLQAHVIQFKTYLKGDNIHKKYKRMYAHDGVEPIWSEWEPAEPETPVVTISDIGTMEIEDFQKFSFKENVLYKFDYCDYSDCLGVYENSLDGSKLKFISLRNGITGVIDTTTGEVSELGGGNGQDGFSPTAKVTQTSDGATITITDKDGTTTATVVNGKDGTNGVDGQNGKDGVGIKSIVQHSTSTADGGTNVIEVTTTDNTTATFLVKNGSKGEKGEQGLQGLQGEKGDKGDKGDTGVNGKDGATGEKGADGYTPIKGVDYFTEEDKAEIVKEVIESLGGSPVFGYVDENNNIVVSGNLAEGSYSVKYEMEDGSTVDIGSLVLADEEEPEEIINQIPISINTDGSLFVGTNGEKGYKTNTRLSVSAGGESTSNASGLEVTGYIPVKYDDTVYLKGITIGTSSQVVLFFDADFNKIIGSETAQIFGSVNGETVSAKINATTANDSALNTSLAYMRICAQEINSDSIITVNQPIE